MVVTIALRKANPIRRLTTRNDDFLHPQLTCRLNDIVCTHHVSLEALVIRNQHVSCISCEMYDRIDGAYRHSVGVSRVLVVLDVEIRGEGIEDLASICEVGLQGVDGGMGERVEVEVKDVVAALEEVRNYVPAGLA